MKKLLTILTLLMVYVSSYAVDNTIERIIWSGNEAISYNAEAFLGSQYGIGKDKFTGLADGNTIRIYYTPTENQTPKYKVIYRDGWNWNTLYDDDADNDADKNKGNITISDGVISYTVQEGVAEKIKNSSEGGGMVFSGIYYTITKVSYIRTASCDFTNLNVGDKIKVTFSKSTEEGASPSLTIKLSDDNVVFSGNPSKNESYEFEVTSSNIETIVSNGLILQEKDLTVSTLEVTDRGRSYTATDLTSNLKAGESRVLYENSDGLKISWNRIGNDIHDILEENEEICVTVKEKTSVDHPRVTISSGWDGIKEQYLTDITAFPYDAVFSLSESITKETTTQSLKKWITDGFYVYGDGYTVTKVVLTKPLIDCFTGYTDASTHSMTVNTWSGLTSTSDVSGTSAAALNIKTSTTSKIKVLVQFTDGWNYDYTDTEATDNPRSIILDATKTISNIYIQNAGTSNDPITITFSDISFAESGTITPNMSIPLTLSDNKVEGLSYTGCNSLYVAQNGTKPISMIVTYADGVVAYKASNAGTRNLKLDDSKTINAIEVINPESGTISNIYLFNSTDDREDALSSPKSGASTVLFSRSDTYSMSESNQISFKNSQYGSLLSEGQELYFSLSSTGDSRTLTLYDASDSPVETWNLSDLKASMIRLYINSTIHEKLANGFSFKGTGITEVWGVELAMPATQTAPTAGNSLELYNKSEASTVNWWEACYVNSAYGAILAADDEIKITVTKGESDGSVGLIEVNTQTAIGDEVSITTAGEQVVTFSLTDALIEQMRSGFSVWGKGGVKVTKVELYKPEVVADPNLLWSGTETLSTTALAIAGTNFSNVAVGNRIFMTFSTGGTMVATYGTSNTELFNGSVSNEYASEFEITSDNIETIKASGITITGATAVLTKIERSETAYSTDGLSLTTTGTYGWEASYETSTKTITFNGAYKAYGWNIGNTDYNEVDNITFLMAETPTKTNENDNNVSVSLYVDYVNKYGKTETLSNSTVSGLSIILPIKNNTSLTNGITRVRSIYLKTNVASTVKLANVGTRSAKNLSTGTQKISAHSAIGIAHGLFENASVGDVLTLQVSNIANGAKYSLKGHGEDTHNNWTSFVYDQSLASNETTITRTLTSEDLAIIQDAGLSIEGSGFTCGDVTLTTLGAVDEAQTHTTATYTLTITSENGSVTVKKDGTDTDDRTFDVDTELTLTATAEEGYTFSRWMSGETELDANTDKSLTITMDANKSITAVFEAAADTRTEQPINMTENVIGNWNNFTIKKEKFNNVASTGDVIKIYVKDVKEDAQISLKIPTGDWAEFKGFNPTTTDTEFSYTITSEVLAQLKEYGLAVSGKNYTSVKLTLKTNGTVPIENYALTYAASPEIGGTVAVTKKVGDASENIASGTTVAEFTELTATVTANEGFTFKNWQVNGQDKTNQTSTTYKFVMDKDASLLAVFNPPTFEYELTLWEDSKAITWDDEWSTGNSNENFSQVKKNDMIRITFTKSDDSPQMQIWQKDADWNGTQIYGGDVEEPSYAFFVANDAMATNIMERGLYIKGQNATITKIELLTNSVVTDPRTEKILVEKTQAIADGDIEINRGLFSNAVVGDIIRIYATDLSATSKIALATDYDSAFDGANWTGFTESPFALKLTASLLSKVQEKNLLIRGENFTFTKAVLYTEKELGEAIGSGGEEPEISNTDASEEAKKLFNVLKDLYGKKIVSGVVANVDWNTKEAENVYNWTGKWPALNVYDFINLHASKDVNSAGWVDYSDITTAKNWWKEGGIVGAMWHWQVKANNGTDYTCTPGTAANETSFDASKVYVDGTDENTLAKQQLDQLCGYLKKMQDAGIPVVWRPLHEASGNVEQYAGGKAWFWWGAKGADVYKQLWQWMYNYMVKTKGLNNLIWVWTSQTKDNNWYPGDAYVDIIGRDNYGATAATLATEYEVLKDTYSNKMMTLSECGNSETAEMAKLSSIWDAGSRWSWFMTWYDGAYNDGTSTTHKHADKTWWDDAMAKDYVVTRDQMKELLGQDSGGGSQTGVNISLDDLNEGWSSTYDATTKTITTTGEWAARGWYIGDDRYSQKGSITVKYEAVQFGVTLKMEYTNTNGDSKSVSAGAAAGETEVELDIPADVKTIEKVYITYQPIGTLKLTAVSVNDKVVDNRTEKTLVETSQAISDGDIKINRGLFSNAVAKDVLYIYATGLSDASKIALEPADYSGALDGAQWTAFTESPFTLKLTESALATIKEKGLLVRGENFTFTKATLYTESELGSIIPDEEEPSIDPEVPSTNEPVINEGGEVKLDEVKAQDETTTVTYNKEEETLTITTTEPYKAAQIWLNEPEEVINEVLKVEIAESNANVIVTVGYTDGTETSAASSAATAASRTLRALSRGATEETGTVVTVPLSAGKEIQKIEIKNVEPGTITITSMSVTTLINEGETVTLWSSNEGETLTWNDIARQTTDLTNLLKEYDELLITVSARAEGNDWPKVFLRDINYESVGRETLLNEVTTFPYIVRYVLTSELLEKIKNGFSVCGDGVTITKVELYRPVPPKEGDIHLRSLDYGYGSSYDASITTMTTTTRWAARGWEIGDMRYNSKDLVIIGYEAVDFPVTIKMEYVDDKGQKQATSTGVAAGQNYVQMAIPEGITQLDRVYLTYQNPGSLKLTEASVVTTGEARSRGFINDGVTTGIKDVKRSADMNDKWYDMNGRQVKQPSKGLYIKNGKKIMHH